MGLLLRYERSELPETKSSHKRLYEIEATLPELGLDQLQIQEASDALLTEQAAIEKTISSLGPAASAVSRDDLMAMANNLITRKRE